MIKSKSILALFLLFSLPLSAAPQVPVIQKLTQSKGHKISLKWSATAQAESHEIYRNGRLIKTVAKITTFTDRDVTELSTYSYAVKACDRRCSDLSIPRFILYTADHGKLTSAVSPKVDIGNSKNIPTDVYFSTSAGAEFLRWTPHKDAVKTKIYINDLYVYTVSSANPIYQVLDRNPNDKYHLVSVFKDGSTSGKSETINGPAK